MHSIADRLHEVEGRDSARIPLTSKLDGAQLSPEMKLEWRKIAIDQAKLRIERDKIALDKDKIFLDKEKFLNEAHHRRSVQTNLYATTAIRNVLIINGAAAIASLTYMGNAVKSAQVSANSYLLYGCSAFGLGVFSASMCATLAYGARLAFSGKGTKPLASTFLEVISWAIGLVALFCFPVGAFYTARGLDIAVISNPPSSNIRFMEFEALKLGLPHSTSPFK